MANWWQSRIVGHAKIDPEALNANPLNHRLHPKKQRDVVRDSIVELGFIKSVLVNKTTGMIVDGHERVHQAIAAKQDDPSLVIDVEYIELTPAEEAKALAVLDASSELAEVDAEKLEALLGEFETNSDSLNGLLDELAEQSGLDVDRPPIEEDDVPEPPAEPITKLGDLWLLGEHRLLCGDTTNAANVSRLLNSQEITMLHADPPYGMGKEKDGVQNDNLYQDKLDKFQMQWWQAWRTKTKDNASAYIWGNAPDLWRLWYQGGLQDSERLTFRNEIAWDKQGEGNPTLRVCGATFEQDRSFTQSERCLFFMIGEQGFNNNSDNYWQGWDGILNKLQKDCDAMGWTAKDIQRICGVGMYGHWFTESQWTFIPEEHYKKLQAEAKKVGEHDAFKREHDAFKREHDELKREHDELKREFYATRAYFNNTHDNMTDVWQFKRVTGEERHGHATPKPVQMVARAIKSSSKIGDCVGVPFGGTCPEIVACEQLDRRCFAMEIDPRYCDVIVARWEALTGQTAVKQSGDE